MTVARRKYISNPDVIAQGSAAYQSAFNTAKSGGDNDKDAHKAGYTACLAAMKTKADELIAAE